MYRHDPSRFTDSVCNSDLVNQRVCNLSEGVMYISVRHVQCVKVDECPSCPMSQRVRQGVGVYGCPSCPRVSMSALGLICGKFHTFCDTLEYTRSVTG